MAQFQPEMTESQPENLILRIIILMLFFCTITSKLQDTGVIISKDTIMR